MDPELAALLAGFHVPVAVPVQWGDQDAFQHVNNTVYFRWFETARIAYTMRVGLHDQIKSHNIGPILASATCDYRRQLSFPDTVHIATHVTRIGRTSLSFDHIIISETNKSVAAEGRATIVMFDYGAGVPVPVSETLRKNIEAMDGKSY